MSQHRLNGGPGNDSIRAAGIFDRFLKGDDGDDLLVAVDGLDPAGRDATARPVTFDGGAGTDTAGWEDAKDPLGSASGSHRFADDRDRDVLGPGPGIAAYHLPTHTLTAVENLTGTGVGDVLTGNAAANTLIGGDGNDNLNGAEGNDALFGGDDLDNLVGSKGSDTVDGGLGVDVFRPTLAVTSSTPATATPRTSPASRRT